MYQTALVETAISDGQRLIDNLRDAGLQPGASFWYLRPEASDWRLVIEVPLVETVGLRGAYEQVGEVLNRIQPPLELKLSEIALERSESALVTAVKGRRNWIAHLPGHKYLGQPINMEYIEELYVYRI